MTAAGTRAIILPPSTAELLRERKRAARTDWIFPAPLNPEQLTRPSAAYDRLKILLKQAGLPDISFHALRHTFVTMALQNEVDVKTVFSMLRHYDAGPALRTHTHATRQKQDEAAATMGSFMAQVI